ncbi:MAG: DUF418 domain-containing protein [Mucinivorans sp.]
MIPTNNSRIEIADVLRGVAIMAIILLHSIEHFNFYSFPETSGFLAFTDRVVWDGLFFTFAGKAYAIFSLLFGMSFFIQDHNHTLRGGDFRGRFAWRLFLLFLIGNLDAAFFTAEVLVLYSLVGFALIPVCRLKTRTVLIIAGICLIQPMALGQMIYALLNPDFVAGPPLDAPYWATTFAAQQGTDFWVTLKTNLWEGQIASLAWAWENGRVFQTAALFMMGLVVGRTNFISPSPTVSRRMVVVLLVGLAAFLPLYGLANMMPNFIDNQAVLKPLLLILNSLHKVAFMAVLVGSIVWLYYNTVKISKLLSSLRPYGRMSLTNYVTQSMIGVTLFYGWGFALYQHLGITYSFLVGVAIFFAQFIFSRWWMGRHKHGPLEWLWKKATWVGIGL